MLQVQQRPADLYPFTCAFSHHKLYLFIAHQCAEFRVVVEDAEALRGVEDQCVFPGDGNVSDADLALVSSAELDPCLWGGLYHHDALFLFCHALEHQVPSLRLIDPYHLILHRWLFPIAHLHIPAKLSLAHFALKPCKVVMLRAPNHFFLDLDPYPLEQAFEMD